MVEPSSLYTRLASRNGFNSSVRHIQATIDLLDSCDAKRNLADEINALLSDKVLDEAEIQSVCNMLLVEKWKYVTESRNIASVVTDATPVIREAARMKGVDIIIGYHHPDLGFIVINPKNPECAPVIQGFRKNELVVIYVGSQAMTPTVTKNAFDAIDILFALLEEGVADKPSASLLSGPYVFTERKKPAQKKTSVKPKAKATRFAPAVGMSAQQATAQTQAVENPLRPPAPAAPAVPGRSKMSGLNSVVVTNELFHNGNVEAWKRIIRSYNAKYPDLQVLVYYDGERIVDINTLFKWGKVKHGSCIQFAVSGENIQDLAKLSRYFRQGASPQFEAFLHGSPDTVMNLF